MLHRLAVLLVALALLLPLPALAAAPPSLRQDSDADLMPDAVQARIAEIKDTVTPLVSTFNTDDGAWDADSDEDITRSFAPGVYQLRNDATQTIGWSMYDRTAADFYAEVDTYQVDGPTDNEFGILFRHADDDNYWVFSISSDGYYRLDKQVDNQWETAVDWIQASSINTGEGAHNVIGLLVEGRKIAMLVNGEVLSALTDNFTGGDGLGVSVGTHDEGGVEIAFEDFRLWPLGATGDNGEVTPEPTPEPTPEVTVPDPALIQTDVEPIRANRPDYQDDFRRASDRWPTSSDDQGAVAFADRGLNITIDAPNYALWTSNQEVADLTPGDVLVEADATANAGADNDTYGLVVRFVDNDNFYYFGISNLNTFSFWRVVEGQWTKLQDWTYNEAILSGENATNRLGVLARGDTFLLYANDTPLAEVTDSAHPAGSVGFYAGTYETPGLDVTFDNLDVWVLSTGEIPTADTSALDEAQARIEAVRADTPAYSADYRTDDGEWTVSDDPDLPIKVERSALQMAINKAQWLAWADRQATYGDFLVAVDAQQLSSDVPTEVGVVFRVQDEANFYFFAIDNTGRYSLWKKVNDEWQSLRDWTKTDAIDTTPEAENRLAVLAEGATIAVSINDQVQAVVEDDSLVEGKIGLAVGTFDVPGAEAAFDTFELWTVNE